MIRAAFAVALTLSLLVWAPRAFADDEEDPNALFQDATKALAEGRTNDAIAKLEALGDHGVIDAVVSFDLGLAYAERVRTGGTAEQPGDLGRAAHGFEEARSLTHDRALDRDASAALAAVRAEIAKRRSRAGEPVEIGTGISLGRSLVDLLPENAWAILAAIFSAALAVGIVVRARGAGRARVAGTTTCAVAGALLAGSAALAFAARDARLHLREGVVVTTSRLLDDQHVAIGALGPVPEGARVRILDDGADYTRVAVGTATSVTGWLPASTVLPLAKP